MIRNFEELPCESLAWSDTRFKLTFRHVPELLQVSVREFGVLNPLIVGESTIPDRYAIVTGWLRFEAARKAGESSVPCHIYRNFPQKILLLCALFDNVGHRTLNPIEQALAVKRLSEFYSLNEVCTNFLPLLGLRPNRESLERLSPLMDLNEEIQWALANGCLNHDAALILAKMPGKHPSRVFRLLMGLRVSPTAQKEMVENFYEIWQREDYPPGTLIDRQGWQEFEAPAQPRNSPPVCFELPQTERPHGPRRGKETPPRGTPPGTEAGQPKRVADASGNAQSVRAELRRMRFPHLQLLEKARDSALRELSLPPEARLATSRSSADASTHRLEIRFRSPVQLRSALMKVLSAEERGLFKRVFSPGRP